LLPTAAYEEKAPTMNQHILLVDDHADFRRSAQLFLEKKGYRVTTAQDGVEALEHVDEETPDLIILDVMMPRLDGWATLESLQSQPRTADIPVLMLTALKEEENMKHSFRAGCTWFHGKPITDLEDFVLIIRNILESGSAATPA